MRLGEVLNMIFGSGNNHVVKVVDEDGSELLYSADWEAGNAGMFEGSEWVRSISDDTALITVRLW